MKRGTLVAVVIITLLLCGLSCFLGAFGRSLVLLPHIQMAPENLLPHSPVPFTNTMFTTLVVDVVLVVGALLGTRAIRRGDPKAIVPQGLQNLLEMAYEAIDGMLENILEDHKHRLPGVVALLMTIFFFILVANWIELIPGFDSIGLIEPIHEGEGASLLEFGPFGVLTNPIVEEDGYVLLPFLRAPNTDLNVPLAMALIAMFMVQYYGVYTLGPGYFLRFFNVKAIIEQGPIGFFMWAASVLEIISEFSKIISFTFRLFGNIFAGMVLLLVMIKLLPFLVPSAFYGLEIFVGMVQALVFMMLTASFIAAGLAEHGAHEEEHPGAA